ncbi:MAG TPA: TonB-dependent receptor [Candidatus Acidoferrum sp.]|nr:TonB-dependent receptor [Candidatus Acidoferrum sp.]
MKSFVAALIFLGLVISPGGSVNAQQASQTPAAPLAVTYQIAGKVHSGKTPLPGVTVTASNSLSGKKYSTATLLDGSFLLGALPRGRYVLRTSFMGFAEQTQEVVLNPESPAGKADFELVLASRQQEQSTDRGAAIAAALAGKGFQNLTVEPSDSGIGGGQSDSSGEAQNPSASDLASLPMNGAGAEGPTESVSISGAEGRTQDFGSGNDEVVQRRIEEFRQRATQNGEMGGFGGGGFGGGGFGGGERITFGRFGRGFNVNQPHGFLYFSDDTSAMDASPYSLSGIPQPKADYNQSRFGANVGGPLHIPKIYDAAGKTFFFGGWNGSRGSTPFDALSTVPTVAERGGNFSALTTPIYNPATGQQFVFNGQANVMDPSLITPQAQALLNYIPLPNLSGATQNYHLVTSGNTSSDAVSLRLIHNFGAAPSFGGRGPGGGGRGGRRGPRNNLNMGMNWSRSKSDLLGNFPSLDGGTSSQGLGANVNWVYGRGRATNILRFNYNHNHVSTTNLYSAVTNVPALAQIGGVSTAPFDWGIPALNFTSFSGLSDPAPRRELDQTYTLSDNLIWNHAKHNMRFGGDYRRILQSFRSARNAEGAFVFTGFATSLYTNGVAQTGTGSDFADFLLGLPQQSSVQFGTSAYNFRSNSYDFFAQDDWRFRPNLTLLLGIRYEYQGPFTEAKNQIANLDVAPGFAAASPVEPGQTGPFNGVFPASLIRPDRNNFAPRLGLAWKPLNKTVVRAGYGVNYNLAQYNAVIQNFAFQPPFAETATNVATTASFLTLANAFPSLTPGAVTNNFAVNPDYRLAYVQLWNVDIQRELPGGFLLNAGYNGSKGTRLDTERALLIAGQQPFTFESSEGSSVYHGASVRVRKRVADGLGFSASYIYSKSIDDASSIGGGGVVVAQNPFDISADRGLSSFDQRHKFSGNWIYEFPFGENHKFLQKGAASHIFSGWQYSGNFTVASGLPFTIRVLGGTADIQRGVSGSLRANLVAGQPFSIANPTTKEWFNVGAFCQPQTTANNPSATCVNAADSIYGDAGRNILQGPGQVSLDMSLNKTIDVGEFRALDLRFTASNVFNMVNYTSLGTSVNSITFGQVTGVGTMRRVTVQARFRF